MKIIHVLCCAECPYADESTGEWQCSYRGMILDDNAFSTIPDWCPLEDEESEK